MYTHLFFERKREIIETHFFCTRLLFLDFVTTKKYDVSVGVSESKVRGKLVDKVHEQEIPSQDQPKSSNESSEKLKQEHDERLVEFGTFEYQCTYVFGFVLGGLVVMTCWTLFYEALPDWLITPLDVVMPEECDYAEDVYKIPKMLKLMRTSRLQSIGQSTQGNNDGHFSTA